MQQQPAITHIDEKIDEKINGEYPGTHDLSAWSQVVVTEPPPLEPHKIQGDRNPAYLPVQGTRPS
jgi:hypothetical protein